MITSLQFKVFERMHGRTVASAVAASTARSAGQVSERTVRNWLGNRTTPEPETLEQVVASSRAQMLKSLETSPWPAGEREALVETLDACPGFVSGFAATLQNGGGKYPVTIELARKIDLLEQALGARRSSNDLGGWVKTLLKTPWVQDEHLTHPDNGTDAEATRRMLLAATSWDDLILPVAVVAINIQFQLLATLDLEFCASYLPDLEATPIFASLLPRLHPQAEPIIGTSKTRRDLFQYPTRRLLDATACLRTLRQNQGWHWPTSIPSAGEMIAWLDLAGCEKSASNLLKWRCGRAITAKRFEDLWNGCFRFVPEPERPATPLPMLYAVTVFTELFVKGSREDGDLEFTSPDPAFYQHWWELQRQKLSAGAQPLRFGTRKWMPGLA